MSYGQIYRCAQEGMPCLPHGTARCIHTNPVGVPQPFPLPATLRPWSFPGPHSPGAHEAFQVEPGATEQTQVGHGEAMEGPEQLLIQAQARTLLFGIEKRPESELSLEKKN